MSTALRKGIDFKLGRNKTWFTLAVDFCKAGYPEDKTVEVLREHYEEERDFKEKEWLKSISQGYKYVQDRE